MRLELIIDCRERDLIEHVEKKGIPFSKKQLELGDVLFLREGEEEPVLIIERKSTVDLLSSIADGRYREQKCRMMNCGIPRNRILYLIENKTVVKKFFGKQGKNCDKTILSAQINTMWRDGLKVFQTTGIEGTVKFLKNISEKIEKNPEWFTTSGDNGVTKSTDLQYSTTLKKRKKDNITPDVWFINSLSIIPGVTEYTAIPIVNKYKNVSTFIREYLLCEDPENMLKDIITLKGRKIGPVMSKRIYEYYMCNN